MNKVALLIGVSEYTISDFKPLPAPHKDVEALREILQDPQLGGFEKTNIKILKDPNAQEMRSSIEELFDGKRRDDLLLLYFSGHGVVRSDGAFYLAPCNARKNRLNSTGVGADYIHKIMGGCRSRKQVIILDCCFSGAFAEGLFAKGEDINLSKQLSGQGRAVLTSSSSSEYSLNQKDIELSTYTQCLVDGISTGEADLSNKGEISAEDLHAYISLKIREVAPEMTPKFYPTQEGYRIRISGVPVNNPEQVYRRKAESLVDPFRIPFLGFRIPIYDIFTIDSVGQKILEGKRKELGISDITATAIRNDAIRERYEYSANLRKYSRQYAGALRRSNPITARERSKLASFQRVARLKHIDVENIENGKGTGFKYNNSSKISVPLRIISLGSLLSLTLVFSIVYGKRIFEHISDSDLETKARSSSNSREFRSDITPSLSEENSTENLITPSYTNDRFDLFLSQAKEKIKEKEYRRSVWILEEALEIQPDSAEAHFWLGKAHFKEGRQAFSEPGESGNNSDQSSQNSFREAIRHYSEALDYKYVNLKEIFSDRGEAYWRLEEYQNAIEDLTLAISRYSYLSSDTDSFSDAGLYNLRGLSYHGKGDFKRAVEDYKQAIDFSESGSSEISQISTVYYNLSLSYLNLGEYELALQSCSSALDKFDANSSSSEISKDQIYEFRADLRARTELEDIPGAIEDLRKARTLNFDIGNVNEAKRISDKITALENQ